MVLGAGIGARACLAYSHSRAVLPMSGTPTWYARAIRPQGMNSRFFFVGLLNCLLADSGLPPTELTWISKEGHVQIDLTATHEF